MFIGQVPCGRSFDIDKFLNTMWAIERSDDVCSFYWWHMFFLILDYSCLYMMSALKKLVNKHKWDLVNIRSINPGMFITVVWSFYKKSFFEVWLFYFCNIMRGIKIVLNETENSKLLGIASAFGKAILWALTTFFLPHVYPILGIFSSLPDSPHYCPQ